MDFRWAMKRNRPQMTRINTDSENRRSPNLCFSDPCLSVQICGTYSVKQRVSAILLVKRFPSHEIRENFRTDNGPPEHLSALFEHAARRWDQDDFIAIAR